MKVTGMCQSFLHPCNSYFSTEIQPVQKLQKKFAAANQQNFLLMLSIQYLIEVTWMIYISIEKSYFPGM